MEKKEKTPTIRNGIGYWEAMSLILFTLKLLGVISCSWWIVFLPLFIGWSICLIVISLLLIIGGVAALNKWLEK